MYQFLFINVPPVHRNSGPRGEKARPGKRWIATVEKVAQGGRKNRDALNICKEVVSRASVRKWWMIRRKLNFALANSHIN